MTSWAILVVAVITKATITENWILIARTFYILHKIKYVFVCYLVVIDNQEITCGGMKKKAINFE